MDKHVKVCRYAEALDTSISSLDGDALASLEEDTSVLYQAGSTAEIVTIGRAYSIVDVIELINYYPWLHKSREVIKCVKRSPKFSIVFIYMH